MSDNFIPLSQSTPVHRNWEGRKKDHNQSYYNNRYQHGNRRGRGGGQNNRWSDNSQRNISFGSDSNRSNYSQDSRSNIDAYLHPSMLEDPWKHLRQKMM